MIRFSNSFLSVLATLTVLSGQHLHAEEDIRTTNGYLYVNLKGKVIKDQIFQPTQLSPEGQFPLGSTSKQITGLEILRMMKTPQYDLTPRTLLSDILPEARGSNITIRDLLQHRSGLGKNPVKKDGLTYYTCDGADILNIQNRRGNHISRERAEFNYSNYNYCLLSKVVEKLTGQPFPKVLRDDFFSPLGMNSTFAAQITDHFPNLVGSGGCGGKKRVQCEAHPQIIPGAGGVISTPNDYKKWVGVFRGNQLFDSYFYRDMKKRLLEATPDGQTQQVLAKPKMKAAAKLKFLYSKVQDDEILYTTDFSDNKNYEPYVYDYGLRFRIKNNYLSVSHTGTMAGHKAFMVYYPELDLFIFLFKDTSIRQSAPAEAFRIAKGLESLIPLDVPSGEDQGAEGPSEQGQ